MEEEFENLRYAMQEERLAVPRDGGRLKGGATFEGARRIIWTHTNFDVYRKLVRESGWTPDRWLEWLPKTLLELLVATSP